MTVVGRAMQGDMVVGLCLLAGCVDDVSGGSEGTTGSSATTSGLGSSTAQAESSLGTTATVSSTGESSTSVASNDGTTTAEASSSGDPGCDVDCRMEPSGPCTLSVCNLGRYPGPIGECVLVTLDDGSACTPESLCETTGACEGGACVGVPIDCEGSVEGPCEVAVCDLADGLCVAQADEGQDGQSCDDGNPCSTAAVCEGGECQQESSVDCSELDTECSTGLCDPTDGSCGAEPVAPGIACFVGVPQCNVGECDAAGACVTTAVTDGTPCDDANLCTSADQCVAGSCGGEAELGYSSYFSENFESCSLVGWTLNPQWECGVPESVGPAVAFQGQDLLGTDLDDTYDNGLEFATSFAQLPEVSLVDAVQPALLYQAYVDTEGATVDGYNVQVSTDGGATFSVVTSVEPAYPLVVDGQPAYGGPAMEWAPVNVDLAAFAGQSIVLRFAFQSDGMLTEPGVYIDAVQIVESDQIPVAITTLSLPDAVEEEFYSFGLSSIGGTGDGVWSIVEQTNAGWLSLTPSGVVSGLPGPANVGPASVTLRIEEPTNVSNFAEMAFDFDVAGLVYTDDFEAACPGSTTLTGDWQCGAPTSGPNFAFSGTQVVATVLASNYNNNLSWATNTATSTVISLLGTTSPQLSFRVWYDTEGGTFDGFNLRASSNGGASYELLTEVTPAYPLTIGGQAAWGGDESAQGWQQYTADLSAYAGMSVSLQIGMRSDGSLNRSGVYIDDFAITD